VTAVKLRKTLFPGDNVARLSPDVGVTHQHRRCQRELRLRLALLRFLIELFAYCFKPLLLAAALDALAMLQRIKNLALLLCEVALLLGSPFPCLLEGNPERVFWRFDHGLRGKLNDGNSTPAEALKSAVSAFDSCCRNMTGQLAERVALTAARQKRPAPMLFHGLDSAAKELLTVFDIDLFKGVDAADISFVRMMFHRRHAFEHDGGHATARYIRESGDTSVAEGTLIRENRENVHRLIGLLNRMAGNLSAGFHELFPPEEEPVAYAADVERRRQRRTDRVSCVARFD
jgi:hypothetical protein